MRIRPWEVIHEAYVLLGHAAPGEATSRADFDRGDLHLLCLVEEFPDLNESRMAHKLAERLYFRPAPGFWGRLRWLMRGNAPR
jgi:hypothetical protein